MRPADSNRFSAAGPALGYLAQIEYALLFALNRMEGSVSLRLSIETADDIVFEAEGRPTELWQTKHSINKRGSVTDSSEDLWKTLHNWIAESDDDSLCFLFTTSAAPEGSAAGLLGVTRTDTDIAGARERLNAAASTSQNSSLQNYFKAYLDLSNGERLDLLRRVTVLDQASRAAEITDELIGAVRKAVRPNRRLPLVERLRGWWHGRAMNHLNIVAEGGTDWIDISEIEEQLLDIAQELRDDALPLDYTNEPRPNAQDADSDDRIFVEQLKLIMLHNRRISLAIYDHNRAFLQRSRWQRDQLLGISELAEYDQRLIEEWERAFLPLSQTDDHPKYSSAPERDAVERYAGLEGKVLPELRPAIRASYVPTGSLHILADRLEIGWHPNWIELLRHRFAEVETTKNGREVA